jgi:hypothetical protein
LDRLQRIGANPTYQQRGGAAAHRRKCNLTTGQQRSSAPAKMQPNNSINSAAAQQWPAQTQPNNNATAQQRTGCTSVIANYNNSAAAQQRIGAEVHQRKINRILHLYNLTAT